MPDLDAHSLDALCLRLGPDRALLWTPEGFQEVASPGPAPTPPPAPWLPPLRMHTTPAPPPSAPRARGPRAYSAADVYQLDDVIEHPTFGRGRVYKVEASRVRVQFQPPHGCMALPHGKQAMGGKG